MKHLLLLSVIFAASESYAVRSVYKECRVDDDSTELAVICRFIRPGRNYHNVPTPSPVKPKDCPVKTPSPIKHGDDEIIFDWVGLRYSPTDDCPVPTPKSPNK